MIIFNLKHFRFLENILFLNTLESKSPLVCVRTRTGRPTPPFSKGEVFLLLFKKGGREGFIKIFQKATGIP
ncbi:MAG: hypothetical protein C0407_11405 [Desulfobacca sp.]|nr:hypothetical protein [Desulfobacca sp.]